MNFRKFEKIDGMVLQPQLYQSSPTIPSNIPFDRADDLVKQQSIVILESFLQKCKDLIPFGQK